MTPTIVDPRTARIDGGFMLLAAVLVAAVVSPLLRNGSLDTSTKIAVGFLAVVLCAATGGWRYLRGHPVSLVVSDDEIHLDPPGRDGTVRRIERTDGALRLRTIGSVRARTLILEGRSGGDRLPLAFLDRDEILDACHDHGWSFD